MNKTIFVGNITYDGDAESLAVLMREAGPVTSLTLMRDTETKKLRGYGYCEYENEADAITALHTLNGRMYKGRSLRLDKKDGTAAKHVPSKRPRDTDGDGDARPAKKARTDDRDETEAEATAPAAIAPVSAVGDMLRILENAVQGGMPRNDLIVLINVIKKMV
jgi:RNA recognition motif-containing protein